MHAGLHVDVSLGNNEKGSGAYGPSGSRAEPWPSFLIKSRKILRIKRRERLASDRLAQPKCIVQ
jgi:hypothetical protein